MDPHHDLLVQDNGIEPKIVKIHEIQDYSSIIHPTFIQPWTLNCWPIIHWSSLSLNFMEMIFKFFIHDVFGFPYHLGLKTHIALFTTANSWILNLQQITL